MEAAVDRLFLKALSTFMRGKLAKSGVSEGLLFQPDKPWPSQKQKTVISRTVQPLHLPHPVANVALRRGMVSGLAEAGVPTVAITSISGHKSVSSLTLTSSLLACCYCSKRSC